MQLLSTLAFLVIAVQCVLASPERKLLRSGYDTPVDFSAITGGGAKTDATTQQQSNHGTDSTLSGLPGLDSITKGLPGIGGSGGLSKLVPAGLPSTDVVSSITKGNGVLPTGALSSLTNGGNGGVGKVLPADLSGLTKGGALSSLTGGGGVDSILGGVTKGNGLTSITDGITKGGNLPSLPNLPIGTGSNGADLTKGLSGITDKLSGITNGLSLPSTSTSPDSKKSTNQDNKNAY